MKSKIFRYSLTTIIGLLLTVGTVNAVGVFYYDSVKNEFVLDGNLRVNNPGQFDIYYRELNSLRDSDNYINSNRFLQLRFGKDSGATNYNFGVNNASNFRVMQVDNGGGLKLGPDLSTGGGTKFEFSSAGAITKVGAITSTGNLSVTGTITGSGALTVTGPTRSGRLFLPGGQGFTNNVVHSWGIAASMGDGQALAWGGGWTFGHTTGGNGFHWGNASSYIMKLTDVGNIHLNGSLCDINGRNCKTPAQIAAASGGGDAPVCTISKTACADTSWVDVTIAGRDNAQVASCGDTGDKVVTKVYAEDWDDDADGSMKLQCCSLVVTCS